MFKKQKANIFFGDVIVLVIALVILLTITLCALNNRNETSQYVQQNRYTNCLNKMLSETEITYEQAQESCKGYLGN